MCNCKCGSSESQSQGSASSDASNLNHVDGAPIIRQLTPNELRAYKSRENELRDNPIEPDVGRRLMEGTSKLALPGKKYLGWQSLQASSGNLSAVTLLQVGMHALGRLFAFEKLPNAK